MNITKDQWTRIIGIVLGAAIAIAAVLGWVLPLPTPTGSSQSLGVQRFNQAVQFLLPATFLGAETHSGIEAHSGDTTISNLTATTITTTNLISQAVGFVGDTATITKLTATNITSTNVISMAGATFTGPIKYGTAANYTSGTAITHGFTSAPTVCMLWPAEVTATVTIAATTFTCNTATHTNPIYWMCAK